MIERASWPTKDWEVRAILDGRKTQTRRVVKPQPFLDGQGNACWNGWNFGQDAQHRPRFDALASPFPGSITKRVHCPYGRPGDRLWVRETWAIHPDYANQRHAIYRADRGVEYDTDRWRPSIHMPRWACRIVLEIVSVRVERLQSISEADALAEGITKENLIVGVNCYGGPPVEQHEDRYFHDGCPDDGFESAGDAYAARWQSINGPESWQSNPWVWVIEHKRVNP